jgi:hypothetical protein
MLSALRDGFRSLARNWGLVLLVLATNLAFALVLAVPFARQLDRDLAHTGASDAMMYGFDYDWWSSWSEKQVGPSRTFGPDVLGTGFAFKNLDLLLRGRLPGGLFADASRREGAEVSSRGQDRPQATDAIVLGVGALYVVLQVFLLGGLLGVFRSPRGGWTFRGLAYGSGFYFGRLLRVSVVALALAGIVFALDVPFARWVDRLARDAVSERTALVLLLGRHAVLLAALLLVHMVASFARVVVVTEERRSALLAWLTSLGFCARNLLAAAGQYAVVIAAAVLLLGLWSLADARLVVTGWRSQLLALAGFEALVVVRIALRLGLLAGQLELYRARAGRPEAAAGEAAAEGAAPVEAT